MWQRALSGSGGGGSTLTIEDVTASSNTFTINNGIVIQYVKASGMVRATAIIENGVGKILSNMGFGAVTVSYSSGVLTITDTIYTAQPSAIAYIKID